MPTNNSIEKGYQHDSGDVYSVRRVQDRIQSQIAKQTQELANP